MTMTDWKPGDVARVDYGDGQSDIALRLDPRGWEVPGGHLKDGGHLGITFRRLVVIDPEDAEQVERLRSLTLQAFRDQDRTMGPLDDPLLIDLLRDALREFAAPTPPKPEEPQGLGAVVEDAKGERWVRGHSAEKPWMALNAFPVRWSSVAAVRVVSEGVTS